MASWLDGLQGGHFCWSPNGTQIVLMVDGLRDGERWWWVVGYLDTVPALPEWVSQQ